MDEDWMRQSEIRQMFEKIEYSYPLDVERIKEKYQKIEYDDLKQVFEKFFWEGIYNDDFLLFLQIRGAKDCNRRLISENHANEEIDTLNYMLSYLLFKSQNRKAEIEYAMSKKPDVFPNVQKMIKMGDITE